MSKKEIKVLLDKYKEGQATDEDKALLESWYLKYQEPAPFELSMAERIEAVDTVWKNLEGEYRTTTVKLWPRIAGVAAAILIFISAGTFFLLNHKDTSSVIIVGKNNIQPGKNKATLTLASGRKIVLSDATNGQIANEAGVSIRKDKKGELVYVAQAHPRLAKNAMQFNTIQTSNGEQYQVVLPDGSRVWLNAASSLKYPVAFAGRQRLVQLTGEAYFEVAHDKSKPFRVQTDKQLVEVLGTHFNINSYADESSTKTTLLQGSVKVTAFAKGTTQQLNPGQQLVLSGTNVKMLNVDTEQVVAWKNGLFMFDNEDLGSIMRKVSRWYNVKVVYQDSGTSNVVFGGSISRFGYVSEVLDMLQVTGNVRFKIENNIITVYKK